MTKLLVLEIKFKVMVADACSKGMQRSISMQGLTLAAITAAKKLTLPLRIITKSWKHEMLVKVTRSQCMQEKYAKDNYYARFNTSTYHCCKERHFTTENYDKVIVAKMM